MTFGIDNPRGGCNNPPPLGKYVWEKPSGEQGLIQTDFPSPFFILFYFYFSYFIFLCFFFFLNILFIYFYFSSTYPPRDHPPPPRRCQPTLFSPSMPTKNSCAPLPSVFPTPHDATHRHRIGLL